MGNINKGNAKFLLNIFQFSLHILSEFQIERTERLVQQKNMRSVCKRTGNGNSLLLSARKRINRAFFKTFKINESKHFGNGFSDFLLRLLLQHRAERYVLIYIKMRKKSITLKDGIDPSFMRRQVINSLALKNNVTAVRFNKACDSTQSGSLTASGRSKQRYKLFFVYIQIQIFKHCVIAVTHGNIF